MLSSPSAVSLPPLRLHLLGGFRALVGARAVLAAAWRLRKALVLVKLLALVLARSPASPRASPRPRPQMFRKRRPATLTPVLMIPMAAAEDNDGGHRAGGSVISG